MSTISLDFGVHTRNWPRIDLQPLQFNSEFYFWRFRSIYVFYDNCNKIKNRENILHVAGAWSTYDVNGMTQFTRL